jgi:hypothetical protein
MAIPARLRVGKKLAIRTRQSDALAVDRERARAMGRVWITPAKDGKVRVLLGDAAVREKRRIGRRIDDLIAKALRGGLQDSDAGEVALMAGLADQLARGKAV